MLLIHLFIIGSNMVFLEWGTKRVGTFVVRSSVCDFSRFSHVTIRARRSGFAVDGDMVQSSENEISYEINTKFFKKGDILDLEVYYYSNNGLINVQKVYNICSVLT